jgi:hypothetical protein
MTHSAWSESRGPVSPARLSVALALPLVRPPARLLSRATSSRPNRPGPWGSAARASRSFLAIRSFVLKMYNQGVTSHGFRAAAIHSGVSQYYSAQVDSTR